MQTDPKKEAALAEITAVLEKHGYEIGIDTSLTLVPVESVPVAEETSVEGDAPAEAEAEAPVAEEPAS